MTLLTKVKMARIKAKGRYMVTKVKKAEAKKCELKP